MQKPRAVSAGFFRISTMMLRKRNGCVPFSEVTMKESEKASLKIPGMSARLLACAGFLRGRALADIGTDHAYLPSFLAKSGKIPRAVASDIAEGPIRAAERTLREYGVENLVQLRQGNGLSVIDPGEADDIVIAGMGGDLIVQILSGAPWLRSERYRIVLQPMTQEPAVRRWLFDNSFVILSEEAVLSGGKVYTVMCAEWGNGSQKENTPGYFYFGLVDPKTPAGAAYFEKVRRRIQKMLRGAEIRKNTLKAEEFREILKEMNEKESAS